MLQNKTSADSDVSAKSYMVGFYFSDYLNNSMLWLPCNLGGKRDKPTKINHHNAQQSNNLLVIAKIYN